MFVFDSFSCGLSIICDILSYFFCIVYYFILRNLILLSIIHYLLYAVLFNYIPYIFYDLLLIASLFHLFVVGLKDRRGRVMKEKLKKKKFNEMKKNIKQKKIEKYVKLKKKLR